MYDHFENKASLFDRVVRAASEGMVIRLEGEIPPDLPLQEIAIQRIIQKTNRR